MVELLEAAVAEMHDRAGRFGGRTRTFTLSAEFPFLVVLVDELAFLTAYQPERDLRKRAEAAIATLTSQGRSVGVCVVGALQDPRKDVISLRNLFSTRIALRLDESDQVDMVLGDGARDRGALADEISPLTRGPAPGSATCGWRPPRIRSGSAPPTSPTTTSARWPAVGYLPGGWPMRETAWRTDEPCPVCGPGWSWSTTARTGAAGRMPPVRLRRGPATAPRTKPEVTGDPTGGSAAGPARSGSRCRWPGTSSRTWPPSTAPACGRSSSAAPTSTPAASSRCSSHAGTPSPRSARRAPNAPGRCGRPSAARAGTWTTNR